MRYAWIKKVSQTGTVAKLCRLAQVSRSGYLQWRNREAPARVQADRQMTERIVALHQASRQTSGRPRLQRDLREQGHRIGNDRLRRLMRGAQIRSVHRGKYVVTTHSEHRLATVPNRLARQFEGHEPNRVWLADITYIPTAQGWLYLAAVLDLGSRRIVGWSMAASLTAKLALDALKMALGRRRPGPGLLHHSDRGMQYACEPYRELLARHGVVQSMSRAGNAWDNAPMESWFHTLKVEWVHRHRYETREQGKRSLVDYIEGFYNPDRRHSAIGYLSPMAFERQCAAT